MRGKSVGGAAAVVALVALSGPFGGRAVAARGRVLTAPRE
jgi:hypothetical protein